MKSIKEMAGNMMATVKSMIELIDADILDDYMVASELKAILSSDNFALLVQEMINRGYISREEMRRMFAFEPADNKPQHNNDQLDTTETLNVREGAENKNTSDRIGTLQLTKEVEDDIWKRRVAEFFRPNRR